jgi:hypothetical protein
MTACKEHPLLSRVDHSNVKQWLCDAWPKRHAYPDEERCKELALGVNTIVDRHNARPRRAAMEAAIKLRRDDRLRAGREARALQRSLNIILENLRDEATRSTIEGLAPLNSSLSHHIAVVEQLQAALEAFAELPTPPKFMDHADDVFWIENAVCAAWCAVSLNLSVVRTFGADRGVN